MCNHNSYGSISSPSVDKNCSKKKDPNYKGFIWGKRHTMTFLGFIGTALCCSIQNNLSLAIVRMTQERPAVEVKLDLPTPNTICPTQIQANDTPPIFEKSLETSLEVDNKQEGSPKFLWNEKEQGLILGSFYWGFIATQYHGGLWAQKYGGKWIFSGGILIGALSSVLLPLITIIWGPLGLVAVRVIQGFSQGVTCPSMQVLLANWSPRSERSRMTNIVYTGYPFGSASTLIAGGYIIRWFGWPALFYVVGALSLIWFVFWALLIFNSPWEHPTISAHELHLIEESIKENFSKKNLKTPWKDILQSLPVWAILVFQVGLFWGKNIIQVEIPKYLGVVHGLQIHYIGWIAAIPHFLNCASGMIFAAISDLLIIRQIIFPKTARKFCASIVGVGTSAAFLGMGFFECETFFALSCLVLGGIVGGAVRGSWMVNMIDIAPNFAGTLMAVGNVCSYFLAMITPYVTGIILHLWPTLIGWKIVFVIGALMNFFVSMFFVAFSEATEQYWNKAAEKPLQGDCKYITIPD